MSLQKATTIALYGVFFLLIISLTHWILFNFDIISYFDNVRLYRVLQLLIIFLQTVPIIIFLIIFKKRHKS